MTGRNSSVFAGKWKFVSQQNFAEYLKVIGIPWLVSKLVCDTKPNLEVTNIGNHFRFTLYTSSSRKSTDFFLDKEFEEEQIDGRKFPVCNSKFPTFSQKFPGNFPEFSLFLSQALVNKENENKLIQVANDGDLEIVTTREVDRDDLIIVSREFCHFCLLRKRLRKL